MSDLVRMSVSIEKPLFEQLEKLVADSQYENRSEFVRDLIRSHIVEQQWQGEKELIGTISIIYDHHVRGLSEKLTESQHHFAGAVLAATHIHLDEHLCAEMIMVRGRGRGIKAMADTLRREKGVLHANLAIGTTGEDLH